MAGKDKYLQEVVPPFTPLTAMEEASRCTLCLDPPCSRDCPAGTDPGSFIRSIRFRNFRGAAETIRKNNILGGVCARVCPYEKLCEEACSRTGIDRPIEIGRLQRFATDYESATGFTVLEAPAAAKEKVAMIGSGPGSLAAAADLAMRGYKVTVFESKPKAGGIMRYGIVPGRLPEYVIDEEVKYIEDLGVEFKYNTKVGKDVSLDDLRSQGYKAFMVGIGLQNAKLVDIPGLDLDGVDTAIEFLANARSKQGAVDVGTKAVVIGGGDVALDCATTCHDLGADTSVLYRRTREEMPATKLEVEHCESKGIKFYFGFKPEEVLGKNGSVVGIKGTGFRDNSKIELEADKVVFAIGQVPEDPALISEKLAFSEHNKFVVSEKEDGSTNVEDIFVAGDILAGSRKMVVTAVAEGKTAAESIDTYLTQKRDK